MTARRQWHRCIRCGAEWLGRNSFAGDSGLPKRCAKCRSPLWNTERKRPGWRVVRWRKLAAKQRASGCAAKMSNFDETSHSDGS